MDPSKFITSVIQQLASPAIEEFAKVWNVDKELGELLATYCRIQDTVEIWKSRWEFNQDSFKTWLQELEGYLYDTEDLVDYLSLSCTNNEENEDPGKNRIRGQTFTSFSMKSWTTPHKIVELRGNLERVSKLLNSGQNNSTRPHPEASSSHPRYRSRLSDKMPFLSGTIRDQDKQNIIENLMKCDRSGVSIVGIDGLGKTALARTIIVDETIKSHYPLILSASASGDFHMTKIVHQLVASCLETSPQAAESQGGDAGKLLQELLCKERALIILDDLWSVKDEDWQRFEHNYLNLSPGGKILITTSNPKVAEVTKSIAHDLVSMTDKDCIKLITETGHMSAHECGIWASEMKAIAKKCQGLPIIANKVGLELSKITKMDEKKDKIGSLQEQDLWDLPEFREVFLSLNLNELKLPLHLKRCFAYCSLFPLGHKFNKEDLIQLWEVEGFIQPQERISSKAVARKECFDDMLSRSILHPSESSENEQPIYKMHEYRHWFAQLLAPRAFCRVDEEGTSNSISSYQNSIRHLSLNNCQNIDKSLLKKIERCKGLRTFLLLHQNNHRPLSIPYNFFEKLQSLRLLDLSLTNISTLSNPASLSKHLRYLDVSNTLVDKLPKQIQYLRALQVLKLRNCSKLRQLPKELNQLRSLTHLHFSVKKLVCPLPNMGKLTNLEVLDSFFVGKDDGCKVLELSNMKNLTELHIFGLDVIGDAAEAKEAMLIEKPWLKTLVVEWKTARTENAKEVLEGLQPHNNLNVLKVSNYGGELFPVWLISPRCQLVSIYLDNCPNCEVLPTLGQLPILKNLVVRSIHKATSLDDQFCGQGERAFPCLELLEFYDMTHLAKWTGLKVKDMPCLRALKIAGCPVLLNLPSFTHLSCLINLEINNCPSLQLLPELPSSLNAESGKLIIANSGLVKERYQYKKADWPKIRGIPYVEIHATRIQTEPSGHHRTYDKDQVSKNEEPPTFAKPVKGNNVSQVYQDEVSRSQEGPTTTPKLGDETHTSKKNEQDQPPLQNLEDERQMVQDKMSEKEHDSATHPNSADESCTSQHEEPGIVEPLSAPPKVVDEIAPGSPEYKKPSSDGKSPDGVPICENSPKRRSSSFFGFTLFKGCFAE